MRDAESLDIEVGRHALRTFGLHKSGSTRQLHSLYKNHTWESGTAVATCLRLPSDWYGYGAKTEESGRCESPPGKNCHCGLYGAVSLRALWSQYSSHALRTVAVFAAEGETIIGDRGLRTSAARIVGHWTPRDDDATVYDTCEGVVRFHHLSDMVKAHGFSANDLALAEKIDDRARKYWEIVSPYLSDENVFSPPTAVLLPVEIASEIMKVFDEMEVWG